MSEYRIPNLRYGSDLSDEQKVELKKLEWLFVTDFPYCWVTGPGQGEDQFIELRTDTDEGLSAFPTRAHYCVTLKALRNMDVYAQFVLKRLEVVLKTVSVPV
jgi:hypothetical protein